MDFNLFTLGFLVLSVMSCTAGPKQPLTSAAYADVKAVGAMREVMWQGELGSSIDLDTISEREGLYGLGPESYLTGELLIIDGQSFVSRVATDSAIFVEQTFAVSAPFLVYANVYEWQEMELPETVKTIQELEAFIAAETTTYRRPFAFKLTGKATYANIHIQNLPPNTTVSSPDEAHQGQVNYDLFNEEVEIIGFFSTEHQGVFTHHDSFLHMHLVSTDKSKMGHLDELEIEKMRLHLPLN